ncbi:hypothetical protein V6N13_025110 [Hibiscus sabdariffa]
MLLKGATIGRQRFEVGHLLFADDSILFCEALVAAANTLQQILITFGNAYGQRVSFEKSLIFYSGNVSDELQEVIASLLRVRVSTNPEKYMRVLYCEDWVSPATRSSLMLRVLHAHGVHHNVPIGELSWKEWAVKTSHSWYSAQKSVDDLRPLRSHVNWRAPSADMVKCNFDVASCSTPHWFVADPFQAEALACLVAVKFAQDLGFTRVIVEGDSLTVIVKCRSKLIDVSLISLVVVDIKDASKFFESINFSFVHREANEVAHTLAQEGKSFNSPMY